MAPAPSWRCPAHDSRDHEFAAFRPAHRRSGRSAGGTLISRRSPGRRGPAVNSGALDGLTAPDAKKAVIAWLEEQGLGKAVCNTGCATGVFAAALLGRALSDPASGRRRHRSTAGRRRCRCWRPSLTTTSRRTTGNPPLARADDWVRTTDPSTGLPALRETNTMPQWAGSCWYYLRFADPKNEHALIDPARREILAARRPLYRRRRARRAAPALRALLAQGAVRHRRRHDQGAVPEARQPGHDPRFLLPGSALENTTAPTKSSNATVNGLPARPP